MTATQVFLMFLKKCLTHEEYMFFRNTIMYDNGNKYFSKRRLYKNDFVEGYLSRNNRTLSNFVTRLFILAPNLKNKLYKNPRYKLIRDTWRSEHEGKEYKRDIKNPDGVVLYSTRRRIMWLEHKGAGMYVNYYKHLWNKFLREYIDDSEKKINSPFKKGETYNFKLKKNGEDSCV